MQVPPLRQELALHEGPRLANGQPTWTVQDPSRNRFFRIDWLTFEILCQWEWGTTESIASWVRKTTPLDANEEDVLQVLKFLATNELLVPRLFEGTKELARAARSARESLVMRVIHNYLFFRISLARPDRLLSALVPATAWLFSRAFFVSTVIALLAGIALAARQWEVFNASLVDTFSPAGMAGYASVLVFAKLLHEFGHGIAARRQGCHVPSMGVAFMVLWPVPYTDVNEVWKLADRWARFGVSVAGVATELIIAIWATLAWSLLEDGPLRSAAFLLATTTWISTLLINLSPFMRFDGYFVLSDLMDIPNLHARSFAMARWRLRETLFRLGDPPPEDFSSCRAAGLIFFACVVWIYRLLLFVGIALLVYTFFIKVVGIVLFAVEIIWFVAMPIFSETKVWWARRADITRSRRTVLTAIVSGGLVALLSLPLPWRVQAGAMLHPGQDFGVFALDAARIDAVQVRDGQRVEKNTPLFTLSSMLLDERRTAAASRVSRLASQVDAAAVNPQLLAHLRSLQEELEGARAALRGIDSERSRTMPIAPAAGIVRFADPDIRTGMWVARNEVLAKVVDPSFWYVDAYVSERDVSRLYIGAPAIFYPEAAISAPVYAKLISIEQDTSRVLPSGVMARSQGGMIAAREIDGKYFPDQSTYRVRFETVDQPTLLAAKTWRGTVSVLAEKESVGMRLFRGAVAVLWREAGW